MYLVPSILIKVSNAGFSKIFRRPLRQENSPHRLKCYLNVYTHFFHCKNTLAIHGWPRKKRGNNSNITFTFHTHKWKHHQYLKAWSTYRNGFKPKFPMVKRSFSASLQALWILFRLVSITKPWSLNTHKKPLMWNIINLKAQGLVSNPCTISKFVGFLSE